MDKTTIHNIDELQKLASKVAQQLRPGSIIALVGDLGAGKTTFTKSLVEELGGDPDQVTSPTFSIMQQYELPNETVVAHYDLYRLKSQQELEQIGFLENIEARDQIIIIEWPEIAKQLLPADTVWIEFKIIDEDTREAIFDLNT